MIDMNENMSRTNGPLLPALTQDIRIIDPIKLKHHELPAPITLSRGSCQIDVILVSPELRNIVRGGWTVFGDGIGDHRIGLIDIKVKDIVGIHKLDIIPKNARRLTCEDPHTIKRYNDNLRKNTNEHNLLARTIQLQQDVTFPASEDQMAELDYLHKKRAQSAKEAENKCHKFKSGAVVYAPDEVQAFAHEIHSWKLVVSKLTGHKGCSIRFYNALHKNVTLTHHVTIA